MASPLIMGPDAVLGFPQRRKSNERDNGPELVADAVQKWLGDQHVGTHYIALMLIPWRYIT
ncbi:MAG: hypothetical protein K0U93_18250 [Gammaproteobacteria bacterium]|nr:hypothetical protein [Gammaproteobacteria bacterium]